MTDVAKLVRVSGRVQGVGFRAWTKMRAFRLGLDGWVRNEPDGSVAALICGDAEKIERMLADLRDGPLGSDVSEVVAEDVSSEPAEGFEIRH